MTNQSLHEREDRLHRFFAAENARDWSAYATFLHPDVEWVLIGRSDAGSSSSSDVSSAAVAAGDPEGSTSTVATSDLDVSTDTAAAGTDPANTAGAIGRLERLIAGRDAYVSAMRAAYKGRSTTFRCEQMFTDTTHGRIACLLVDDHGERSLDIFDFDGPLIRREWEFLLGCGA
ncbi:MAG: hypothetical protein E7Z96_10405 [Actinomycetaceae bacterium]|nr:hypothetical protein [Actinomycetaceae bacterium]